MNDETLRRQYCHRLVTAIEETRKQPLQSSVREAFLHVPRHLFVNAYYEGNGQIFVPLAQNEVDWHYWLTQIYRDEPLITQRDEHRMPTSSSSQPSVMEGMLEALDVQSGQTILEIGTGTGYNAALLATLVEDPHLVTTIDIDPVLIEGARSRLEQAIGSGMTIEVHNGIDGYASQAPYNRIIATGSFFPVPRAWIEQLKPEGKLVMDLHGQLGGGLIVTIKQLDGQAVGRFLSEWRHISFMRLRSAPSITWRELVSGTLSAVLTDHVTQTVVIIEPQEGRLEIIVRGECHLWSEIFHTYQDWLACGEPGLEAYTLYIDQQGRQIMKMDHEGISRTFALTTS